MFVCTYVSASVICISFPSSLFSLSSYPTISPSIHPSIHLSAYPSIQSPLYR